MPGASETQIETPICWHSWETQA